MGLERAESTAAAEWVRATDQPTEPVVETAPYLELALEHPGLDATHADGRFFPDAVPYRADGESRVFYWRSVLAEDAGAGPGAASAFWATTHELRALGAGTGGLAGPRLLDGAGDGGVHEVVVDGTVAGDSTTARVRGYSAPSVSVRSLDADAATVAAAGETATVAAGDRAAVELPEQTVRLADSGGEEADVAPVLRVRFPGVRTLYHPPADEGGAVFPSFGLDLGDVPDPVSVPTAHGELDHGALADALGVDLDDRPYAERTLWQAFAYAAFDPHRDDPPRLRQTDAGLLVVANPAA